MSDKDMVSRTTVIRGASIIVGASAVVCWVGTIIGGTVLIHPLISTMAIFGSIVFYAMSKMDK